MADNLCIIPGARRHSVKGKVVCGKAPFKRRFHTPIRLMATRIATLEMVIVMNRMSLVILLLCSGLAHAGSLVAGDADAGKSKAVTCAACHGAEGVSVNPEWPSLAGQHAKYTIIQLQAFKDGKRNNALMNGQAMMLSVEDMNNLAVYFESFDAPKKTVADAAAVARVVYGSTLPENAPSKTDDGLIARGEALYRGGDSENKVAACIACHGPAGAGNPAAAYPSISGQHAVYTAKTLIDYASGARQSGENQTMQEIAARLSREDIVAISVYVQGLR